MNHAAMHATELLDISGRPLVMLGGEYTYQRHVAEGIVTEYTWRNSEPVMILFKDGLSTRQGCYLIELKDAYRYAESDGNPVRSIMKDARDAAVAMGYDRNDHFAVHKIVNQIVDGLPGLVAMPPVPPELEAKARPTGNNELTFKLDGKTLFEGSV